MRETKKPELKKITQEDLNQKLAEYKQWRDSNPPESERFDLSQYDLRGCAFHSEIDLRYINLSGSDLTDANLIRANLGDATLISVNFSGANLFKAQLLRTDLTKADFSNAILTDAKFCIYNDATGQCSGGGATLIGTKFLNATMHGADLRETKTAGMQLGGADVTNAKLPDEIKSFDGLKTVEEASKITKRLFTMLLTALGFSALTILSTKDYLLLTNSTTSPLPIIQTPMPLAGFYWIAPFLLTVFFIYFLLNLLHLYKLISRLPAVFPDGTPLDEKIFPWLLNTLVWEYFPVLAKEERSLFWARKFLIVFLIWLATPFILFWFWFRYLPRHDPVGLWLHIFLVGLVIATIILTYKKAKQTLKNDPTYRWSLKSISTFLFTIFFGALIGFPIGVSTVVTFFPQCEKFNSQKWLNANFAEQEVSHKSDNWNSEKPTEGVKGAMLEHANLDYADATKAFLVNAKLKGASLKHAKLSGAILVQAMLDGKADLTNAHLDKANLIGANLTEAILSGVDFTGADLTGANLYKADLTRADLTGVIGIKPEQIKKAKDWQLAFYDKSFNENYLKLSEEEISSALKFFIKASSPTLSDAEVRKLSEKEMKQYRAHYEWPTGEKTK